MRRLILIALLTLGCESNATTGDSDVELASLHEEEEAEFEDQGDDEGEVVEDEQELARTERTFEFDPMAPRLPTVSVERMVSRAPVTAEQLAEIRESGWNLEAHPQSLDELREATIVALHRIDASEAEWVGDADDGPAEVDLFGIWEVIEHVRASHCDNDRFPSGARVRISQCQTRAGGLVDVGFEDTVENAEETHLSAMRRVSRRVMGVVRGSGRVRLQWIQNITPACDEPEDFPERRHWSGLRDRCLAHAELARQLVTGDLRQDITPGVQAVTWGGRCGRRGYACDDPNACRRGLAAIETETSNRFWCAPGSPGCSPWIEQDGRYYSDELCVELRIPATRPPRRPGNVRHVPLSPAPPVGSPGPLAAL